MVPDGRGEDRGTLLMVRIYLAIVGIVLISLAVLEIAQPLRTLEFWKGWINHRLFFLHGVGLVILGFPFTCYNGSSAGKIIFIIGVLIVLTGPIIILYADKVRSIFMRAIEEMSSATLRRMIYADAAVRLIVGALLVFSVI